MTARELVEITGIKEIKADTLIKTLTTIDSESRTV
jgi:hypothetical protein